VPSKPPNVIFGLTGPPYAPRHGSSNFGSGDVGELKIKQHIQFIINCSQNPIQRCMVARVAGAKRGGQGDQQAQMLLRKT